MYFQLLKSGMMSAARFLISQKVSVTWIDIYLLYQNTDSNETEMLLTN